MHIDALAARADAVAVARPRLHINPLPAVTGGGDIGDIVANGIECALEGEQGGSAGAKYAHYLSLTVAEPGERAAHGGAIGNRRDLARIRRVGGITGPLQRAAKFMCVIAAAHRLVAGAAQ